MEIVQYSPDILTPLTQFYNNLTLEVPHCYPINEEQLANALSGVTTGNANKKEGGLDSEIAYLAIENKRVQAFIHVGIGQIGEKSENDIGVIRFLGYERGARLTGQALIETIEEYLRTLNVSRIVAFSQDCRYRFYHFEHAYLSDALDQVQGLLGYNGYRRCDGEVFLNWTNYLVPTIQPPIPVTLTVDKEHGRGQRPNYHVAMYHNDIRVGECFSVSGGEFSDHPNAQDWLHTVWLGIEEDYQGQGLGRYLLQYTLQEMNKVGYRHAAISTNWENYLARLFYSNCGYRVTDWTYEFDKVIS